jgi:uncharacterized membrane protein YccF (DUF307 family)
MLAPDPAPVGYAEVPDRPLTPPLPRRTISAHVEVSVREGEIVKGFMYTLFVGIPFCCVMCAIGLLALCTIIGIPVGLAFIAVGMKKVTMKGVQRVEILER